VDWVLQHLGLTVLSVLSAALTFYLIYVMLHPERF